MEIYIENQERILALLNELKEVYRQLLYQNDAVVQGNPNRLVDNINSLIKIDGNRLELGFNLPAEWKYVENDTRPHWPPPPALEKWIQEKPVQHSDNITDKQLAYLVGRKIAEFGTEGKHLLEQAITQTDFYNRMIYIINTEVAAHYNKEIKRLLMTL